MAGLDEFAKYVNDRQYEKSQRSKGKAKTGKQRKGKRERTWEPTFTANNPVARYYDPTDDHGIKAHFPTPDYSGDIKEAWLREHPPRAFHPASVSDPAYRRRQADAERRARERLGFTRADQLSVQRSVGVASLLNANLHAGPRRPHAAARAAAWAYPADLDADTSLRRDLHRISEELDAEDARAAAAAVVASVAADAAERRKLKNQRRRERGWTPDDDDDDVDDKAHGKQDDDDDDMPTNEYQGKSARAIAGKLMMESVRNLCLDRSATALGLDQDREAAVLASAARSRRVALQAEEEVETTTLVEERHITQSLDALKRDIRGCQTKSSELLEGTRWAWTPTPSQ